MTAVILSSFCNVWEMFVSFTIYEYNIQQIKVDAETIVQASDVDHRLLVLEMVVYKLNITVKVQISRLIKISKLYEWNKKI